MPTLKIIVRSKMKFAHVRFRLCDGYFDLWYKSPIIVETNEFDVKRGKYKRAAQICPAECDEKEKQIAEVSARLLQVYGKHTLPPATN